MPFSTLRLCRILSFLFSSSVAVPESPHTTINGDVGSSYKLINFAGNNFSPLTYRWKHKEGRVIPNFIAFASSLFWNAAQGNTKGNSVVHRPLDFMLREPIPWIKINVCLY